MRRPASTLSMATARQRTLSVGEFRLWRLLVHIRDSLGCLGGQAAPHPGSSADADVDRYLVLGRGERPLYSLV